MNSKRALTEDVFKYARCIDCAHFGNINHGTGASCDIANAQVYCFFDACVFCQLRGGRLRDATRISLAYFFPWSDRFIDEFRARGCRDTLVETDHGVMWRKEADFWKYRIKRTVLKEVKINEL